MEEILIATKNQGKLQEFKDIFAQKNIMIKSLNDFVDLPDVKETGMTFAENASIKATEYSKLTNMAVIADDSGLQVDALNGRPGIYSARYAGDHNDAANMAKLLSELGGVPKEQRTANFHTALVLRKTNGEMLTADGDVKGFILTVPRGSNGFGYDPLFYIPEMKKSFAEMTELEKNAHSHRGKAIENLMNEFNDFWN